MDCIDERRISRGRDRETTWRFQPNCTDIPHCQKGDHKLDAVVQKWCVQHTDTKHDVARTAEQALPST